MNIPKVKNPKDAKEVLRVLDLHVSTSWCREGEVWFDSKSKLTASVWTDDGETEVASATYDAVVLILAAVNSALVSLWSTLSEKKKALVTAICMEEK